MALANARPVVRYGAINTITAWMQDTTGAVITGGLTGLAATIIKEDGSSAAVTNAPTEISTTGYVVLTLTATECTATVVGVRIVCTNTDAVDVCLTLYPEQAGDIRVNLTHVPEAERPAQEPLDPDYDPRVEWLGNEPQP